MKFEKLVLTKVRAVLEPLANPERATGAENYMKHVAPYLGMSAPDRRMATRPVFKALLIPTSEELVRAARLLYAQEKREYAYAANDLIAHFISSADRDFLEFVLPELLTTKSWWDTVDGLGSAAVVPLTRRFPSKTVMKKWNSDSNIWVVRAALGHQRGRRGETDVPFVLDLAAKHTFSKEFFIVKAIGWLLRDITAFNKPAVRQFLIEHPELGRVATREAERGLNR